MRASASFARVPGYPAAAALICDGERVDLPGIAFASVTMAVAHARERIGYIVRRPFRAHCEAETVLGRLAHQDFDDIGEFLVERAFCPRVLAVLAAFADRLLGERRWVVEEFCPQEILERRRDELRIELER